ncbi:hypothetical protein GEMRC1_009593 [Eukaryota sp. GEM-RC1]
MDMIALQNEGYEELIFLHTHHWMNNFLSETDIYSQITLVAPTINEKNPPAIVISWNDLKGENFIGLTVKAYELSDLGLKLAKEKRSNSYKDEEIEKFIEENRSKLYNKVKPFENSSHF